MPSQVVYQTNADLIASYEALVNNSLVKVKADMTQKGLLWFQFKDSQTVFLLSAMGKLQVKWNDEHEKRLLYKFVKNLLVAKPNEKLVIKPLKQQTWIEYPAPESFKLYWCDEATEFVLKTTPETREDHKIEEAKPAEAISGSGGTSKSDGEDFKARWTTVIEAVEELRRELRFFREPTFNEVALKSGCLDSEILRIGLGFARWKTQSPEEAKWIAEQAINLAGWLMFKETGELNPQLVALSKKSIDAASLDAVGRAQVILKNCPHLVPKVAGAELKWPDETKIEWIKIFGGEPPAPQCWSKGLVFPKEVDDFLKNSAGSFKF